MPLPAARTRRDRCPGVLRPWPADDGALARVRLAGGRLPATALAGLAAVSRQYGDGLVHLTGRANLQLRALPWDGDRLPEEVVAAVEATGLLPSRRHELARNLMSSPLSGLAGGRADVRPVVRELDERLCARPNLGDLPGRFLFVLDDGRGDLLGRETDLGAVVLDEATAQLRVGAAWGPVVGLGALAEALVDLADRFLRERGDGPTTPWHVDELDGPLATAVAGDPRMPAPADPPAYGDHGGAMHVAVPDGVLGPDFSAELAGSAHDLVVTPWHGVVVPTW